MGGHTKDTCFKLHGYPEWYKELKEQRNKMTGGRNVANMADNPLDANMDQAVSKATYQNLSLAEMIQLELSKMMKGKARIDNNLVNFAHIGDLEGNNPTCAFHFALHSFDNLDCGTWIVDTGASNHMCIDNKLIRKPKPVTQITQVFLPNGFVKLVHHIGDVSLTPKLTLTDALCVPSFKYNLLSVNKLSKTAELKFEFYPDKCILQDLQTEVVLAVGKVVGNLYILDKSSFHDSSLLVSCNNQIDLNKSSSDFASNSVNLPFHSSPELYHSPVSVSSNVPIPTIRHSTRQRFKPAWMSDYVSNVSVPTNLSTAITTYVTAYTPNSSAHTPPTFLYTKSPIFTNAYMSFLAIVSSIPEPSSYYQTSKNEKWIEAVNKEFQNLESNHTYKSRLVAKGYHQIEGVDYSDSFSPIEKLVTVRIFLAIATARNWALHQLDINNAFFTWLLANGMLSFVLNFKLMDDVLVIGTHEFEIKKAKQFLHDTFTIKDVGYAKYFLGLEIARGSDGTYVNQRKYVLDILQYVGLLGAKPVVTPLPKGQKFSSTGSYLDEPEKYRRLVSRLLYLNLTRPDISYVVQQLSQYVHSPTQDHWHHVLKYLKGTPSRGLFCSSNNNLSLEAFCDTDWAACKESRKSLISYYIYLGSSLISWKTKKQSTVSRSSAAAEYRSLASSVRELEWISYILQDFQVSPPLPIPLWCDNMATLHITANPVFHERTKHLEIDCHLVRDKYKASFVFPKHISTKLQLADAFTKSLAGPQFHSIVSKLGLVDLHQTQSPT
ncbi:PREDICTED: uncharacterized protein LOC104604981 [Nelumbo nucifera]|uniref:Uncharacterized protein LOC104604981 n=1 Tax=Nelumbo nucifera TaxID=4432 RepID=A0A1U8AXU7_NELNU|nr:PREDICTED: uncharacterized protein LOC104604981 [Nelumbo nucifera]